MWWWSATLIKTMETAERAGAVGICIARRSPCNKAKKIITSLHQLLDLVVT